MIRVLVVCHDCKKDLRPRKGDKYAARLIGGRYRPLCIPCSEEYTSATTAKLTNAASAASKANNKPILQIKHSDDAAVHADAIADVGEGDEGLGR